MEGCVGGGKGSKRAVVLLMTMVMMTIQTNVVLFSVCGLVAHNSYYDIINDFYAF